MAYKNVSFYGPSQGLLTPVRRDYLSDPRRAMEQQLLKQGSSTAPVQSPLEGIARALQGGLGGYFSGQAKREMMERERLVSDQMQKILAGGQAKPWVNPDTGEAVGTAGGLSGMQAALGRVDNLDPSLASMGPEIAMSQIAQQQALEAEQRKFQQQMAVEEMKRRLELSDDAARLALQNKYAVNRDEGKERRRLEAEYAEYGLSPQGGATQQPTQPPSLDAPGVPPPAPQQSLTLAQVKSNQVAKEAEMKAERAAIGKAVGEEKAALDAAAASLPRLEESVKTLKKLGETATYTYGGRIGNFLSREFGSGATEGGIARSKYIAHVKNNVLPLLRETFGAAFTAAEGDSLLATLGDPNMAPEEKNAVLDAFISDKKADLEVKQRRVGAPASNANPVSDANVMRFDAQGNPLQ